MNKKKTIPVVDLFAGPGGLGEGFSSLNEDPFRIIVSAEMEYSAHQTLRLRSYYRILKRQGKKFLDPYYRYCNGTSEFPFDATTELAWFESGKEALQLVLGKKQDNQILDNVIRANALDSTKPWILIGGPPCQAYSLVGRARNQGKSGYRPEEDHRHFLYKEYLRIIQQYRPAIFVMENVKGILSSSVGGKQIFHTILQDLADPDVALGKSDTARPGYRICSLVAPTYYDRNTDPADIDVTDFIVRAEDYGVPQARHRVILLGIREDLKVSPSPLKPTESRTVFDSIGSLPRLRSRLSKQADSSELWGALVEQNFKLLQASASDKVEMELLTKVLGKYSRRSFSDMAVGSLRVPKDITLTTLSSALEKWYQDDELKVWLNHETRGHMASDLLRYAYAASFAEVVERSPKGHAEFNLPGLRPNHKNWESGKFSDRFRVQLKNRPATTITSHISKDGHYFIHPDPQQCRSLTVREAARLQTFPDNYFFQGNRTQQFHQVGNAVPPLLALKIAETVKFLLDKITNK
jgi:DNA (cytosine-5)-methyltransferase 1